MTCGPPRSPRSARPPRSRSPTPRRCPRRVAIVEDELRRIDETCSRFRDDSELTRLNRSAGRPFAASPLLLRGPRRRALRRRAHGRRRRSDGRPLARRARLGLATSRSWSRAAARRRACASCPPPAGSACASTARARTVRIPAGVEIDLGATAKALAADRCARARARRDRRGRARQPRRRHRAGRHGAGGRLADPRHRRPPQRRVRADGQTIALAAGGLATSSTTVRRWRAGGVDVHHIVESAQRRPRRRGLAHRQRGRRRLASRPTRPAPRRSCAARAPSPGSSARACRPGSCAATARPRTPAAGPSRPRHEPRADLRPGLVPDARERRRLAAAPDRRERARHRDRRAACARGACRASSRSACTATSRCWRVVFLARARAHGDHRSRRLGARASRSSCRCSSDRYGLWLGLGALALDLVIALVVTSLLRQRLAPRVWRALHCAGLPRLAGRAPARRGHGHATTARLDARRRRRRASRSSARPSRCAC